MPKILIFQDSNGLASVCNALHQNLEKKYDTQKSIIFFILLSQHFASQFVLNFSQLDSREESESVIDGLS